LLRAALLRILTGQDTKPGATVFNVFASTLEKLHPPIFAPIDFESDIAARRARLVVKGVTDGRGEPILNPVTKAEHRVLIDMMDGLEYTLAEIGRGWTKVSQPINFELADSYAQFAEIHLAGFNDRRGVQDVTDPEIKMPIHALQRSRKNPLFRRRHIELIAVQPNRHAAVNTPLRQSNMLARLPQAANVRFNRLRQVGDREVPLACQPIAPAPRLNLAAETLGEYIHNLGLGARGNQVKVIAQIRPVIQRFHHHRGAAFFFQRITYCFQMIQRIGDAGTLFGQHVHRPGLNFIVSPIAGNTVQHLKRADDYVIGVRELNKVLPLFRRKRAKRGNKV